MSARFFFFIFLFLSAQCFCQHAATSFKLVKLKKVRLVDTSDFVKLHLNNYKDNTDSVNRTVKGIFHSIDSDSIAISLAVVKDRILYSPDATKKRVVTQEYFQPGVYMKYKISDINSIITTRKKFGKVMLATFFTSLATAVVVSPLVASNFGREEIVWQQVGIISGISGGVACISITLANVCDKKHQLKSTNKKVNAWAIQP